MNGLRAEGFPASAKELGSKGRRNTISLSEARRTKRRAVCARVGGRGATSGEGIQMVEKALGIGSATCKASFSRVHLAL